MQWKQAGRCWDFSLDLYGSPLATATCLPQQVVAPLFLILAEVRGPPSTGVSEKWVVLLPGFIQLHLSLANLLRLGIDSGLP